MSIPASSSSLLNAGYKALTKSNSVNVMFVLVGAFAGERALNYVFNSAWNRNNQGKLFSHLEGTVIGGPKDEE